MDKCKTRLGYNIVLPPYIGNFMPPKPDLVYPSLDDFVDMKESVSEPVVEKPTVETNEPKTARKENGAPIIEDWVFECEEENKPKFQTVKPNFTKIEYVKPKTNRKLIEQIRQDTSRSPKGNKRNWNQQISQKLGNDFEMFKKACHVCSSFDHLKNDCNNWYNNGRFAKPVWTNVERVNKQNFSKSTHPSPKRNMVPRTVLTRSGPISLNTARPVNTVQPRTAVNNVGPMKNVINNAYSAARRPFNKIIAANKSNFNKKVNIVKGTRVNTARPKAIFSVVKGNKGNVVKASACWVWKAKHKVLDHGNQQQDLKDKGVIDSGCSRCDNGTEFKNRVMNQFCKIKGIKREFSVSRTPQQNGVEERKNRTLVEAARTILADLKLPTTFWAEAVNRVLVIKPHNKTPYELFLGRKLALSFIRLFGCPVTILNTIDHLGKFDEKADEGFFIGYSTNSKAFKVFNNRTRIVKEILHVQFSENTPNIVGSGPNRLFDIDALTKSMNYKPIVAGNQSNGNAGTKTSDNAGKARVETVPCKYYILLTLWTQDPSFSSSLKDSLDAGFKPSGEEEKKDVEDPGNEDNEVTSTEEPRVNQEKNANVNSTNNINIVSLTVNAAGIEDNVVDKNIVYGCADDPNMPKLEEITIFRDVEDDNSGANMNNLDTYFQVSPVPTTRIHNIRIILLKEPKKVVQALKDPSWIEAMQEELLQFKLYTQEEGIDYDEVFALVARIEEIRLFLAYASFKDFVVYQMDVNGAFLYRKIEEEVYVYQPPGFEDPDFFDRTKIHIDSESTICIVKNPVFHSKTKHIEIRHHFIRDSNKKKLIQMINIHTDQNVADFLTKAFDVSRFQYLIASLRMLNL
ncbi:ribonuclease H-like domain-containing protein [Tanacetum coccineum]